MGCNGSKNGGIHGESGIKVVNQDNSNNKSTSNSGPPKDYDSLYKILLIGDAGVGKTSLVMQWVDNAFSDSYLATIGIDFKIKHLEISGKRLKLQLWDTAGQERYNTITQSYYRGVHGVAVVFDVCDRSSFESVQRWIKDIDEYTSGKNCCKLIIGNKTDMPDRRVVSEQEAKTVAKNLGISYFDVSAKTGGGVDEALSSFAQEIHIQSSK